MNRDDDSDATRDAFRAFALACRAERDRIEEARLAEQDARFDRDAADRIVAELFVTRLIGTLGRR